MDSFNGAEVDHARPPRRGGVPPLVWVLLVLLLVLLLPSLLEKIEYSRTRGRERAEVETARKALAEHTIDDLNRAFELVAKSMGPSVVHIDTVQLLEGRSTDEAYFAQQYARQGQGSGVVIDKAGYILTNNHVVANASEIRVKLSDGRDLEADKVGFDTLTDLAVLRIDADNLIAAEWGDSDALQVGSMVWAIGNPFGLDRSVTFGIISAKSRRGFGSSLFQDFLQTDAAVNPGNSGGPLIDAHGQVVGINTAIIGRAYQGVSFAIPSSMAREVYEKLRETGTVARGWLGVELLELTPELALKLGAEENIQGALVGAVFRDSPAEKAGMLAGDIIIQWNEHKIDNPMILSLAVAKAPIGSTAKVLVVRDGKQVPLEVFVEERPENPGK